MSKDKAIRKIASKCERYVEHIWPHLEKRGGIPDTPMNRKERGHSSPAIGDYGLRVVEANRVASRYLRFFLEELEKGRIRASNGIYFSTILQGIRYDPGALTNWRRAQSAYDKAHLKAFEEVCTFVARGVVFVFGVEAADDETFRVRTNPRDEFMATKREAAARDRTLDARDSYRSIVADIERMETEGYSREAAKSRKARELDCSVPRIEKAITFVNKERRGEVA